jgi:hypothetical protein
VRDLHRRRASSREPRNIATTFCARRSPQIGRDQPRTGRKTTMFRGREERPPARWRRHPGVHPDAHEWRDDHEKAPISGAFSGARRTRTAGLLGAMESRAPTRIWPEPPGGRLVAGVSGLGGHLDESSCRVNFGPFGRRLDAAPRTTPGTASDRCQDTSLGSMTSSVVGRVDRCHRRRAYLRGVVRARRRIGRPQREPLAGVVLVRRV